MMSNSAVSDDIVSTQIILLIISKTISYIKYFQYS